MARHHQLAVRLDDHGRGLVVTVGAEVGGDHAVTVESAVQTPIGVVTQDQGVIQGFFRVLTVIRHLRAEADRHDLAVGLYRYAPGTLRPGREGAGRDQAVAVEARVQAAVRVVTRRGDVAVGTGGPRPELPRDDDLPVPGLDRAVDGHAASAGKGGQHPSVAIEVGIGAAIDREAHHGELLRTRGAGLPGEDDLAVRLQGYGPGAIDLVRPADVQGGDPPTPEPRVQGPVGVEARYGEVAGGAEADAAGRHDLAVGRLDGDGVETVALTADVEGHDPVAAESGIEVPVGRLGGLNEDQEQGDGPVPGQRAAKQGPVDHVLNDILRHAPSSSEW